MKVCMDSEQLIRSSLGAKSRRRVRALLAVLSVGIALTACGKTAAPLRPSTPLAAAQSWFAAINAKDLKSAQSHFVVSQRSMMDWGGGDTATWSTFSHLHCKTLSHSGVAAVIYCSFSESASPSEGNPDSFWTISLQRSGHGPWLINNYGQG
jgi:hypothetical protein